MRIDEEMLNDAVNSKSREPVFRLYAWKPMCISLGKNQKADFIKDMKIDTVRRLTGGRALLHDDEITYSSVFPISAIPEGENVLASYKYISGILINFFKTLGIKLELGGNNKVSCSGYDYCMLVSTGADVCYKGQKLIGSAQCRKNGYILQHGSILYDYDTKLLKSLFNEEISGITSIKEIMPALTRDALIKKLEDFIINL